MGDYKLLDYGYANTTGTGALETRAYSGSAIILKSSQIAWNRDNNTSTEANPARYEDAETNYVSFNNASLSISGVISRSDAAFNALIKGLDDMMKTKGLKLLFYDSSSFPCLVNALGSTTVVTGQAALLGSGIKSFLGRTGNFRITESNNSQDKGLVAYSFTFRISNPITA